MRIPKGIASTNWFQGDVESRETSLERSFSSGQQWGKDKNEFIIETNNIEGEIMKYV